MDLPEWVFPYVYGRLIPTIKLARLETGRSYSECHLAPIVEGLRMDAADRVSSRVTYWRDAEDLGGDWSAPSPSWTKHRRFQGRRRESCFISRASAVVRRTFFISNAGKENHWPAGCRKRCGCATYMAFQYKDPNAILTGSDWPSKIRSEAETCDVFVAIIGKGYEKRPWCREEVAHRPRAGFPDRDAAL